MQKSQWWVIDDVGGARGLPFYVFALWNDSVKTAFQGHLSVVYEADGMERTQG